MSILTPSTLATSQGPWPSADNGTVAPDRFLCRNVRVKTEHVHRWGPVLGRLGSQVLDRWLSHKMSASQEEGFICSHPPCVNKGSHSSDLRTQGNTTQVSACLTRFYPGNMAFPERTALNNPVFQKQEKENSPTKMSLRRRLLH